MTHNDTTTNPVKRSARIAARMERIKALVAQDRRDSDAGEWMSGSPSLHVSDAEWLLAEVERVKEALEDVLSKASPILNTGWYNVPPVSIEKARAALGIEAGK